MNSNGTSKADIAMRYYAANVVTGTCEAVFVNDESMFGINGVYRYGDAPASKSI